MAQTTFNNIPRSAASAAGSDLLAISRSPHTGLTSYKMTIDTLGAYVTGTINNNVTISGTYDLTLSGGNINATSGTVHSLNSRMTNLFNAASGTNLRCEITDAEVYWDLIEDSSGLNRHVYFRGVTTGGSTTNLFVVRDNNGAANSSVDVLTDDFNVSGTATFTGGVSVASAFTVTAGNATTLDELTIRAGNNLNVDNGAAIFQRNNSSFNAKVVVGQRYYSSGVTGDGCSLEAQIWRDSTSGYARGGELTWVKDADYSTSANSTTSIQMYTENAGSANLSVDISPGGNMTISGAYSRFTGTHYAYFDSFKEMPDFEPGMLVEIVGASVERVDRSLVQVRMCDTPNSKRTFGVLLSQQHISVGNDPYLEAAKSGKEELRANEIPVKDRPRVGDNGELRQEKIDSANAKLRKAKQILSAAKMRGVKFDQAGKEDFVVLSVMGVGEGAMFVSDANGPIECGDWISSWRKGIGQKQNAEAYMNYTAAKALSDEDFSANYFTITVDNVDYRYKLIPVTFHTS